jgi:flavin reductase (DIM6/NTAB) family NADH-FMN oxidoreductase RutF/DNA-binding MarR family transcriptional regulator
MGTSHEGTLSGMTANSFSSLSLDPPLVLWSIKKSSSNCHAFASADHFAVSVLSDQQIDTAQRFARSGGSKFDGVAWRAGLGGVPVVEEAVATFECSREAVHDGGDHLLLIGRVLRFERYAGDALLFVQGRYGVAGDHPDMKEASDIPVRTNGAGRPEDSLLLLTLIIRANNALSERLEQLRNAEGLSRAQVSVLSGLNEHPGSDVAALARHMFLAQQAAEDAVNDLIERRYVQSDASGGLALTALGQQRREAMGARLAAFEANQLRGVPAQVVEHTRHLLADLVANRGAGDERPAGNRTTMNA